MDGDRKHGRKKGKVKEIKEIMRHKGRVKEKIRHRNRRGKKE